MRLANAVIDLRMAVPMLDIHGLTFSQFLLYSTRAAVKTLQSQLHSAVAARLAGVKASAWRGYVDKVHDAIEGLECEEVDTTPVDDRLTGSDIDRRVLFTDVEGIEWQE